jgi:hypothetical protein
VISFDHAVAIKESLSNCSIWYINNIMKLNLNIERKIIGDRSGGLGAGGGISGGITVLGQAKPLC